MKNLKVFSLLAIAILASSLAGCKDSTQEPTNSGDIIIEEIDNSDVIAYNDAIVDLALTCFATEDKIWEAYNEGEGTTEDLNNAIKATLQECNNALANVQAAEAREGDSSLKDAISKILEVEIAYYNKFAELSPYLEEDLDNLPEADATTYETIISELEAIDEQMTAASNELSSVQEAFAENHGFELEEVN